MIARSEYAFGTLFQGTIANILKTRLHYGHPDFVDTFWVLNNGGMSKASPNINLSEDAFLGYNNVFDGDKVRRRPLVVPQRRSFPRVACVTIDTRVTPPATQM